MSSNRVHDVEWGNPGNLTTVEMGKVPEAPFAVKTKAFNPVQQVLSKVSSHSKPITVREHSVQDKLGLTTMARILRNMVAENDEEGARGVIAQMQSHEKSEGFTIQDVAGNGLLQIAALNDFDSMTELLLEEGFDINYVDDNHGTALQAAMYMDSHKVLKILLDEKRRTQANVNAVGGYYGCALQVAAFRGSRNYINLLVNQGVDKDVLIAKSKYGTALQAAARTGLPFILEQILALKSVNVNAEGGDWGTALQGAAKGNYTTATTYLRRLSRSHVLRQATNVPRRATEEKTQYLEVAKILLEKGAKVNVRQCGRLKSPLNAAASSGNLEMLKLLLEKDDSSGEDKKEVYGRALLSAITQTFNKNRVALVIELTAQGADVGFVAGNCLLNGPLAAAAAMNDEEVVKYLLEISKDNKKEIMDAESGIYGSALRAALLAPKPARDTALYLIRQGADLSDGSGKYGNILHLAAFANLHDIVEVLLKDYKVNVDALDSNKQTALHIAAYRGYEHVVSSLLNEGAAVNMEDVWGDTPLDVAEDVMGKETHPVPSLQGLRKIREMLLQTATDKREKPASSPFPGPLITKQPQESQSRTKRVRSVFESPKWNPGLNFRASIVDFLEKNEQEYVSIKDLPIDDLLYKEGGIAEAMKEKGADYTLKLRWIHLPANNMTWVKMLMEIFWPEQHKGTTCKYIWGTDPYIVSPDLAPHARFVTPQCGRLIPEPSSEISLPQESSGQPPQKSSNEQAQESSSQLPQESSSEHLGTLFFAMPYIHWESYSSHVKVGKILDKIKEKSSKTRIWRPNTSQTTKGKNRSHSTEAGEISQSIGGRDRPPITNTKTRDYDKELLDVYLFKRWPLHMRRTLGQYYYSYLADTKTRDDDQVAMRARSRKLREETEHITRWVSKEAQKVGQMEAAKPKSGKEGENINSATQKEDGLKPDGNSPVVMVDQLWLWVVSPGLVITSFPRRISDKEDGDLDPEDKTDVLKSLFSYLHSTKRRPIQDAYDLCELVVSQTVGILHRSDMISELDFLKIFATQTDGAINQVMKELTKFVKEYQGFMIWLKENKRHHPSEYIKQFETIFSVTRETELLREIQYIKDELDMLSAVFNDQKLVLENAGKGIDESRKLLLKKAGRSIHNKKASLESRSSAFDYKQQSEKHARYVKRMQNQACQAYTNLQDLLNLKQQQANVLEARVNRNQAITSKEQAKTIMVFTIVTIIFLPLTFMSTVFTLPVLEFPRYDPGTLELSQVGMLKGNYVFGIIAGFSLAFAIPLIIAAFKVKRLIDVWAKMKKFRKDIFPLHLAREGKIPEPEGDSEPGKQLFGRLYWGGPSPLEDKIISDT